MFERPSVRTVLAASLLFAAVGAGCGTSSHQSLGAAGATGATAKAVETTVPAATAASAATGSAPAPTDGKAACKFVTDLNADLSNVSSTADVVRHLRAAAQSLRTSVPPELKADADEIASTLDKLADDAGRVGSSGDIRSVAAKDMSPAYTTAIGHVVQWMATNCSSVG